jgi:hypothetical protein
LVDVLGFFGPPLRGAKTQPQLPNWNLLPPKLECTP